MSKLKNAFAGAKGYAISGLVAASTMVPAFADDFDTAAVTAKIALAATAVAAIGAAVALVWVVRKGWSMIAR